MILPGPLQCYSWRGCASARSTLINQYILQINPQNSEALTLKTPHYQGLSVIHILGRGDHTAVIPLLHLVILKLTES